MTDAVGPLITRQLFYNRSVNRTKAPMVSLDGRQLLRARVLVLQIRDVRFNRGACERIRMQ